MDQKCLVRVTDQANILPVKTSNLPDNCLKTDCYLQPCYCKFKLKNALLSSIYTGKVNLSFHTGLSNNAALQYVHLANLLVG